MVAAHHAKTPNVLQALLDANADVDAADLVRGRAGVPLVDSRNVVK